MQAYREARRKNKSENSVKFSTFSPLQPLNEEEAKAFLDYYEKVLLFSYIHRTNSQTIVADDFMQLLSRERDYFYENREHILEEFVKENPPNEEELKLLEAIKESRYEPFVLLEYGKNTAVIADVQREIYSVQKVTTPFNEVFTKKPLLFKSALVPYKKRYILDGLYAVIEDKIDKKAQKEIEDLTKLNRLANFQKENSMQLFSANITVALYCDALHFEEMEEIVLRKIPHDFTQKMVDMFQDTPFERLSFVSSFVRSTDYLDEFNGDDLKVLNLLNGLSLSNYEVNGESSVIPYQILEVYYKQKPLSQSRSKNIYQLVKEVKREKRKNVFASSFYSMPGVFYIDKDDIDDFQFLEKLRSQEGRKAFTEEIKKLFERFNKDLDFTITPIFLDFGLDLDEIVDAIDEFREYMGSTKIQGDFKKLREYSIYKGNPPHILSSFLKRNR